MNFDVEKVHQLIEQEFKKSDIPGLVIYACDDSGEIFHKAYGDHDLEEKTKLSPDVYFPIASHTKTITAAAVLHLRDQKDAQGHPLLKLDEKLIDIVFPENQRDKIREQYSAIGKVTVEDMLRHRTPIEWDDAVFHGWDRSDNPDPYPIKEDLQKPEILQLFNQQKLKHGGDAFEYSNAAYTLVGKIIEIRSGKPFGEYASENILKPAGFKNILIAQTPADIEGLNVPTGYYEIKGQPYKRSIKPILGSCAPSGGAYAPASAVGDFYHAFFNGKIFPVESQSFKDMTSFVQHDGFESGIGLVKYPAMIGVGRVIGHEGKITGYQGMTFYNDRLKMTVTAFSTIFAEKNRYEPGRSDLDRGWVAPYANHVFRAEAEARGIGFKNDTELPLRNDHSLIRLPPEKTLAL